MMAQRNADQKPPTQVGRSSPSANLTPAPFTSANMRFAYQLHYHMGFRTRRRVPVFGTGKRADTLRRILPEICDRSDYHLLQIDVQDTWVRLLVSLRSCHAPANVVQTIKANSSRLIFHQFPEIEREIGRRNLWSRGYYLRGVGDVTNEVVYQYIARQREHHQSERRDSVLLAQYQNPSRKQFFDLRPFSHCMAEYNCHLVCAPVGHVEAIDPRFADGLLQYVLRLARTKQFEVVSLAVVSDHLHLFAAINPKHSAEYLALAVMNNTSHWFLRQNPGVFKVWKVPGFWTCSAFVRAAGAATTDQVRYHLRGKDNREMLAE